MLERVITFIVLGFFVFVADADGWWQSDSVYDWYSNYLLWLIVILLCYIRTRRSHRDRL